MSKQAFLKLKAANAAYIEANRLVMDIRKMLEAAKAQERTAFQKMQKADEECEAQHDD